MLDTTNIKNTSLQQCCLKAFHLQDPCLSSTQNIQTYSNSYTPATLNHAPNRSFFSEAQKQSNNLLVDSTAFLGVEAFVSYLPGAWRSEEELAHNEQTPMTSRNAADLEISLVRFSIFQLIGPPLHA